MFDALVDRSGLVFLDVLAFSSYVFSIFINDCVSAIWLGSAALLAVAAFVCVFVFVTLEYLLTGNSFVFV